MKQKSDPNCGSSRSSKNMTKTRNCGQVLTREKASASLQHQVKEKENKRRGAVHCPILWIGCSDLA